MNPARRVLAVAILGLAACATPLPPTTPLAPDDPLPARLLEELARRGSLVSGLRGVARVSLDGQRGEAFTRQLVVLSRPKNLRVEVLGLLNQRVLVLASDGEHYDLYRPGEPLESGPVTPGVLLDVAGLPLVPEEAVALLLGGPRAGNHGWRPGAAARLPDGGVRVGLDEPPEGLRRRFEFGPEGELRGYAVASPEGDPLLAVSWDDFRAVDGVAFAHRIDFEFPGQDTRAGIAFRELSLEPEIPADLFRLR